MFILDEPYISPLLAETLAKNKFEVFKHLSAEKLAPFYDFNLIDETSATSSNIDGKNLKFYLNSENSINWVLENFGETNLAKFINIAKDKFEFRKMLKSIYPKFFFMEVLPENLDKLDIDNIEKPFIIKPTVGFLSLGVHKVRNKDEWYDVVRMLKNEAKTFSRMFPTKVVNSSKFIIEQMISGDEYAIDAY